MSDRAKGLLFALLAAFFYGLFPIFGKKFVSIFSPLFVALAVTITAGLFLTILALWKKELLKNLLKKNLKWVILLGFFAALGSYSSFVGLSMGTAIAAGFLFQFQTFFVAILAFILLKEKLSSYQILGLIIMLIGAAVFSAPLSSSLNLGNLFFLFSAFVWGLNNVITRSKARELSPFFLAFGRNTFSVLFLLPFAYKYIHENIELVKVVHISYFLLYGAVIAGFLLALYTALRFVKAAEATSFQLLSPLITLSIAYIFLGEQLSAVQLLGGLLVLSGLYLIVIKVKF